MKKVFAILLASGYLLGCMWMAAPSMAAHASSQEDPESAACYTFDTVLSQEDIYYVMGNLQEDGRNDEMANQREGAKGAATENISLGQFCEGDHIVLRFDGVRKITSIIDNYSHMDITPLDHAVKFKSWGKTPYIVGKLDLEDWIPLDEYKYMKIKYCAKAANPQAKFVYAGSTEFADRKKVVTFDYENEVWEEKTFDMSADPKWKGQIGAFMLMPTTESAEDDTVTFFLEYIAFFKTKEEADQFGGLTQEQKEGTDPVSLYFSQGYVNPYLGYSAIGAQKGKSAFGLSQVLMSVCGAAVLIALVTLAILAFTTASRVKPTTGGTGTGITVTHTKEENGKNIRLGAYVWYGYSMMCWPVWSERFLDDYMDKFEPAWGYGYTEVADMEYQIDLAVESGLSFFAFEYWWNTTDKLHELAGLENFLKAKNNDRLDFTLLVANHDNSAVTYDVWKEVCEEHFIPYMLKDNYLKVDGKPVISFFVPDNLIADMGGIERTRECMDWLRGRMAEEGYPEILILAGDQAAGFEFNTAYVSSPDYGVGSVSGFQSRIEGYIQAGFDAASGSLTYRQYIPSVDGDEDRYQRTFDELLHLHEKSWEMYSEHTDVPFAPGLTCGWDDRIKWNRFSPPSYFYTEGKNSQKFYEHVLKAFQWMKENSDQTVGNIAYIYAWDETDEGAFLIPTKSEGYDMLEAMRRAIDTINAENP